MSYKAIVINPFDVLIHVTEDESFRLKAFDNHGANYIKTCLANGSDCITLFSGAQEAVERIIEERKKVNGIIVMASPYVQESFKVILEFFNFPRKNVYTLSAFQGKRDVTFRDICAYFELVPSEIAYFGAFGQEVVEAGGFGFHGFIYRPENVTDRYHETVKVFRTLDEITFID